MRLRLAHAPEIQRSAISSNLDERKLQIEITPERARLFVITHG